MNSTQQRAVRFRDFLPINELGSDNATVSCTVPILSPTATTDRTKVLHSIFSPPDSGCRVDTKQPLTLDKENLNQNHPDVQQSQPRPPLCRTPKANYPPVQTKNNNTQQPMPSLSIYTGDPQLNANVFIPRAISKDDPSAYYGSNPLFSPALSSISGISSNTYMKASPQGSTFTPLLTSPSSTSYYKDLPIKMLSIPNIQSCDSVPELERIVDVLGKQQEYPSLLRFAMRRLEDAKSKLFNLKTIDDRSHSTIMKATALEGKGYPITTSQSSKQNESSLVMSLSSDEESLEMYYTNPSLEKTDKNKDLKNISPLTKFSDDGAEDHFIHDQVQRLTETIAEMENIRLTEQNDFEAKIRYLNEAKEEAEYKLINLEVAAVSQNSNGKPSEKHLIRSLEQLQKEKHTLQQNLSVERVSRNQSEQKALVVEKQLQTSISGLRRDMNKMKSDNDRKNKELHLLLRSAQSKMEEMKRERDSMIKTMLELLGEGEFGQKNIKNLTRDEREDIKQQFRQLYVERKLQVDAMKEELQECNRKLESNGVVSQKQLSDVMSQVEYLKHSNLQLSNKKEELHNKFLKNRDYYNQLLSSTREQHKHQLQEQEEHFETVISSLKEKLQVQNSLQTSRLPALDSQRAMFSQKLQLQGIKPSTRESSNVQRASNPVATLLHYQHEQGNLSNEDKENTAIASNLQFHGAEKSFNKQHDVKRGPLNYVTFEENKIIDFEKQNSRLSFARAAGGRKGLMEKMKKMRSPREDLPVN